MARRLIPDAARPLQAGGAGAWRRRPAAFVVLVIAVALLHAVVTRQIGREMDTLANPQPAIARMEVAYVKALELEAPVAVVVAPPTPPAPAPRAPRAPRAASSPAASEPEPAPPLADPADMASAPEPAVAEAAASEPDASIAAAAASEAASSADDAVAAEAASAAASVAAAASAASGPTSVAAAASAASAPPGAVAFEWPGSTRVTYLLTGNYRGAVNGSAQVEWIRAGMQYQVHIELLVGPKMAPLIARQMSSAGTLGDAGLVPERYDETTDVIFRPTRRNAVRFDADEVVLAGGKRSERWPGMQDTASQFIQLSWLFTTQPRLLTPGNRVVMPLALPRGADRWTYDVLGEETLQTPFGLVPAFHLKPLRGAAKRGDLSAEIWFAPGLRYLPVRIRIEQDAETYIDMTISQKPELAGN